MGVLGGSMGGLRGQGLWLGGGATSCPVLTHLCVYPSASFLPYLDACFPEVLGLLEVQGSRMGGSRGWGLTWPHPLTSCVVTLAPQFPHVNVRKAACETLAQVCVALHQLCKGQAPTPPRTGETGHFWGKLAALPPDPLY